MAMWCLPAGFCLEVPRDRSGLDYRTGSGRRHMSTEVKSLQSLAEHAGDELEAASATEILQGAVDRFGADWCLTSSMADAVLPHLASRVAPGVDVIFLDTGYHFAETIGM